MLHVLYIGTFGKVYKGVYTKDKKKFKVAIKTLRGNPSAVAHIVSVYLKQDICMQLLILLKLNNSSRNVL